MSSCGFGGGLGGRGYGSGYRRGVIEARREMFAARHGRVDGVENRHDFDSCIN